LTEKVLASQPDRTALGYSEIIIRDIANSVVRELVGIFDSLLDRLLIEKKHDTLRTMVAELVTEDTLKLVATSRDQLKQKEFGHITMELERIGGEARERDRQWEERFAVTRELRDSQDDLYHHMSERCGKLEQRLAETEQTLTKFSEIEAIFEMQKKEMGEVRQSHITQRSQTESVCAQLEDFKKYAKKNYIIQEVLDNSVSEINASILALSNKLEQIPAELRNALASKEAVENVKKATEDRFGIVETRLFEATGSIEVLEERVKKFQIYSNETFCTKETHNKDIERIAVDARETTTKVNEELGRLENIKATAKEMDELRANVQSNQTEIRDMVDKISPELDKTTGVLMALEQRVDEQFATKKYVDDTTRSMCEEVVERSDDKEEIRGLRKDLESEREEVRQTVRQQQQARKDLNDALEDLQAVKTATVELRGRCDTFDQSVSKVDEREKTHWEVGQEEWRKQKQGHDDLEHLFKAFKEEYMSHREYQKAESESLRQHSTQLFMEQMDKAMKITDSINDVALENKKLNDTVRSIRLPPVSST